MQLGLRIMTKDFQLLDEIKQYSSLQITRSWHGIGKLELHINRYLRGADKLERGVILFPHNQLNKGYVIRHKEIALNESGKASETWVIHAVPLKSWLGQRLTYPPDHTGYDNKQGNAETVIKHYVANNATATTDIKRIIPDLDVAANLNRGPTVSWNSRYKNLAAEISEMTLLSGLGWNVSIDTVNKRYVFDVSEGKDLTVGQSINPPVIFSPEFNTLGQLAYTESDLNYRNLAVVAGQGEGIDRRIIEVGESEGHERYEIFVDARDVSEETEDETPVPRPVGDIENDLIVRGTQTLTEYQQEIYLEGQVIPKSRLVYEKDYNLGDMITLQNKKWGVTLDARITEVKEIYEANKNSIELIFNNDKPTIIDKIKQELKSISGEVRK